MLCDLIEKFSPEIYSVQKPYIIAEVGVNHECNMDLAKRLIDEAKEGGADAVKFQTYKAETLASKDSPSYWDRSKEPTDSQYKLFKKYDKFWKDEFIILKNYCDDVEIEFLSTPFDVESANFLNELMDVFKISSSDLNNKPFIEHICKYGKPILLSTGASYLNEIEHTVGWIHDFGNPLALMHCILNYPTEDKNANLGMILDLRFRYPKLLIGYSDHTLPGDMRNLEIATLLGAQIIEKHFTYDKALPGNDHYHAMDKHDLKNYINRLDKLFTLLGEQDKHSLPTEEESRQYARRSLVAANNIPEGREITKTDITWKRPGNGIDPREYEKLIGHIALHEIKEDTVLHWDMFNEQG